MKSYFLPSILFKKKWVWFARPSLPDDSDVVTFFSYDDVSLPDFVKKEGWTSVIDLFKPKEEIWNSFRPGFISEQIKKGERHGIVVRVDDNWDGFRELYKNFRKHKGIKLDDERVFKKHGLLFSAYLKDELLASGVFISDSENIRAWALCSKRLDGQDGKKRETIGQANRMIIWEAIKYGKERNMLRFDFGGIELGEDGQNPPLTVFKEAFGGARAKNFFYTKINSPVLKLLRKIRRILK
ncbi:MAG: hypothetical protein A3H57_00015 [Candidatus Taylorbacteria bacterium RIFCSPLOWO2_02_FULL_43_11]|uniref:BioF2-like acetyltransferase domain-containing protein n=1 Tax=Candidatus Taylorbacteria bacterium RIFCSPHIGHO2_02_FULL_43_32b TaxID=1802306 RepID=A0A1G2MMB8_9BACT|nr:MAG: hypothetical protein A2743_02275 [Candidatus Taylorbacteria bacterium RIFCSPHIGHO2_01_FULL_43_47]OHA24181.1 MAG: hypothetical protein A3C72_03540 [Candidatus Taylorbacteria bacterium RIFCSPHIGHO2_02_FULL_43_32b]OHA31229.1 MAG: hypothetical protein A3B08_00645 [Candidatus Taylorbacteria bacterium RIFCSPLOWO2_01_FULL_43_44]OHA37636.1 MAG: hypothetical protein A3H57_00015 [Candidatus Taylorbacteria bacterium RIFCSPLOWO2_02_FULL_43_11]